VLISSGRFASDPWRRIADGAPLSEGCAIVTLARLGAEGEALPFARGLGVEAPNTLEVGVLAPWLSRLALIAITFPGLADGRGYSLARQLRLRGYAGILRAVGPIIADQYGFVLACGFDEIEISDDLAVRQPETAWRKALDVIGLTYQRSYRGPDNILEARRLETAAPGKR